MAKMTGAKYLADAVHGYGISHVFFMPYIAPRALMEMEKLGVRRVQTHGEKAAAYMADAYAQVKRGPGLCMAQSVGAVNNNHSLNQEQRGVEAVYGERTEASDELWLFPEADFAKIAESMGCLGLTVRKPSELAAALDRAFSAGRPVVVDVKTRLEGIAPAAWLPS